MHRRLWLSIAATAVGAALLLAAGFASPASSSTKSPSSSNSSAVGGKKGGTLRVNMSATDVDYIDPALAYYQLSWNILYITCRPLLNYPDKPAPAGVRLYPDGATSFPKVSQRGTLYTFNVRRGMKFSNGVPITAKNYKAAFDRDAVTDQKGFGPTGPFIGDIAGANAVINGKGTSISGVKAKGYKLTVKLTHQAPDFAARTGMLFFCPIPAPGQAGYPKISEAGVNSFAGSGPYYVASRTPNGPILVKTNKFYKGPRPHNASQIAFQSNTNSDTSLSQVKRGDVNYDMGTMPPASHASLARQYGINKSRYFVHPTIATRYLALKNSGKVFNSVAMRKAANFALDRKGMINLRGAFAGHATDQLLPPALRGFRNSNIFPFRPNIAQARKFAGSGKHDATMYTTVSTIGANQGALVQADFKLIGINVDVQKFSTSTMYKKCGTRSENFDICNVGWIADYPDPYDFVNVLLSKDSIHESGNNNYSYFSSLKYTRMMNAAARLVGPKRYSTYGNLDVQIMKSAAPIAAWDNDNDREFISAKTTGYINQPVYGLADLALLSLK